ncbi:MAG: hypothetical protein ABF785_11565 [Acetobacter papayae]|uniref:hypothetical protein n=1 Tax=Acetobacter papayae TaxID=1076592 RepID=UPI0039E86C14
MAFRFARCGLLARAALVMAAPAGVVSAGVVALASVPSLQAADTLTPAVATALHDAQTALASHAYDKARQAVDQAAAVSGLSAYDDYVITQMRAAVATQAGDTATAIAAYEKLMASSRTPASARNQMLMSEATMAYTAKNYAAASSAISRYLKVAGPNPQMQLLLVQSLYLQRDYAGVLRTVGPMVNADIAAGRKPGESVLQMQAASAVALKDADTASQAYAMLARYYGKKEYWALLLHELVTRSTIPDSLQLDVYRIRLAAGDSLQARDYMDMAEIALQQHLPQLACDLMSQGYTAGVLGTGAEAPRQARLRAMAEKAAADRKATSAADEQAALAQSGGDALFLVGYNAVLSGQAEHGLALMQQAITKGVSDPAVASLHLGLAQLQANQPKEAAATLGHITGKGPVYDIAQLWLLRLAQGQAPG